MRLLNFVRSLPRPAPEPAAEAESHAVAVPVADPPNPRTDLYPVIVQHVEDYVRQANAQSPTADEVSMLTEWAVRMAESRHRPFLPADRARLAARMSETTARRALLIQDRERAVDRLVSLEQQIGPPPPKEQAAATAVVAAVCLFAFGIGASVQPLFATDDPAVDWALALIFGVLAGALIVWSVLNLTERR